MKTLMKNVHNHLTIKKQTTKAPKIHKSADGLCSSIMKQMKTNGKGGMCLKNVNQQKRGNHFLRHMVFDKSIPSDTVGWATRQ